MKERREEGRRSFRTAASAICTSRRWTSQSLRKFEKEIREYRNKEALVIDQRWNGGGNIEQELLAILVQRQYQIWQPRGTEATRPSVRRLLRPEGRAAKLAFGLERRDVPGRLPRAGPGQSDRHADDGRGDRHGQLLAD